MKKIAFSKYSGSGNDFILIDNRDLSFPYDKTLSLCSRHVGIGADGVILLEHGRHSPFKMRIFNADGSEAEMCGNGLRAFTKFLGELAIIQEKYEIENILGHLYETYPSKGDLVKIVMPPPCDLKENIACTLQSETFTLSYINTGVPHAVLFVKDIEAVDVNRLGKEIRHHSLFQPQGTNVNFVALENNSLIIRTFERGVEGETLACGTGSVAAAFIASRSLNLTPPIDVRVRSGDILKINFHKDDLSPISLEGAAKKVFEGSFLL